MDPSSKPVSPVSASEDSMEPLILDTNNDNFSVTSDPCGSQHSEASNFSSTEQDSTAKHSSLGTFVFADRSPDGKVRQPTPSKTRRKSDKVSTLLQYCDSITSLQFLLFLPLER